MQERMMTELDQRLLEDLNWAMAAPEVQQHYGQLVVVRDKRVLGVGRDHNALLASASAQEHCSEDEFVVVVVAPNEVWDIPH